MAHLAVVGINEKGRARLKVKSLKAGIKRIRVILEGIFNSFISIDCGYFDPYPWAGDHCRFFRFYYFESFYLTFHSGHFLRVPKPWTRRFVLEIRSYGKSHDLLLLCRRTKPDIDITVSIGEIQSALAPFIIEIYFTK